MIDKSNSKSFNFASRFSQLGLALIVWFTFSPRLGSGATLEKVNASYGAISGSMAQTWIAKEARLFEKYGLDYVNELEGAGFFDEMNRQYAK